MSDSSMNERLGMVLQLLMKPPGGADGAPAPPPPPAEDDDEAEFASRYERERVEEKVSEVESKLGADLKAAQSSVEKMQRDMRLWKSSVEARVSLVESRPAQVLKTETVVRETPPPPKPKVKLKWEMAVQSNQNGSIKSITATAGDREIVFQVANTWDGFPSEVSAQES